MREVTRYASDDGTVFDTPEAARLRDHLHNTIADIMADIPSPTAAQAAAMTAGRAYLRHDSNAVRDVRRRVLGVAAKLLPDWFAQSPDTFDIDIHPTASHLGKLLMLTGYEDGPVGAAWARLACIGEDGREWSDVRFVVAPRSDAVDVAGAPAGGDGREPGDAEHCGLCGGELGEDGVCRFGDWTRG
jgi:hypothetical protein